MSELKETVRRNLDAALENGYFNRGEQLSGASAEDIADDMLVYCADLESLNDGELELAVADLAPHVKEWLDERQTHLISLL
jgi:hypothetical protein